MVIVGLIKLHICDPDSEESVRSRFIILHQDDVTHISFPSVFDHLEDVIQFIQLFLCVHWCGVDRYEHYILQHCKSTECCQLQTLI